MSDQRRPEDYDHDFAEIVAQIEDQRMAEPQQGWLNVAEEIDAVALPEPPESEWKPDPLPPPRRPRGLVAVAAVCLAYVPLIMLLAILRIDLPAWTGWLAVVAFVAGMVIGLWKLPRRRDPHDGDGAVV